MPQLPPEIIDAIVHKVDDITSLKSCSLVSSALRIASQRSLFRSLTLNGWATPPNYDAISTLLEESPHVASYIAHLSVVLPDEVLSVPDIKSLKRALGKLSSVRWCMVDGGTLAWTPAFNAPFLRFFARQRMLQELHIDSFMAIPQDVLLELLIAAPGLSFKSTSIDSASSLRGRSPPNWARIFSRPIRRLAVEAYSGTVSEFLNGDQVAALLGGMSFLSVTPGCDESIRLVRRCAETVEHLRFNGTAANALSFLRMPALRSVEFILSSEDLADSWLGDTVQEMLRPEIAPRISRIILTLSTDSSPTLNSGGLATLDASLTSVQPLAPQVCWRFGIPPASDVTLLERLFDCVRVGMPQFNASGKLVCEQSKEEDSREGYLYPC
ncbi:hypothetical protein FB45DRAFT_1005246 [Roridomyces roridus]|uniref:F-box domain-containing protein n=1 Tax=Roridomyces roridus TaxID=1738132 RepID=A0AAD7BP15_9AGAR|nr:hypothetical protein FB45DRAFT_1005246 [Roridomyces roridus]